MAVNSNDDVKKAFNELVDAGRVETRSPPSEVLKTVEQFYDDEPDDKFQREFIGILNVLERRRDELQIHMPDLKQDLRMVERQLDVYEGIYRAYADHKRIRGDCHDLVSEPFVQTLKVGIASIAKSIALDEQALTQDPSNTFRQTELDYLRTCKASYERILSIYAGFKKKKKRFN